MTDTEPDDYDDDLESMWRCADCDSRYHHHCTPTDKETQ